jgi:hypothetical protein
MISDTLLVGFAVVITYYFTRRYLVRKYHHQNVINQVPISNHLTVKQKQIETRFFLAKIFIGYLFFCIVLLVTK